MSDITRPVSIRVPASLPDKVRAITGMSFSAAAVMLLQSFVDATERQADSHATTSNPKEPTHD